MPLTPEDIIEAIVDELVTCELASEDEAVRIERNGSGSLVLDYGNDGWFSLTVVAE